MGTNRWLKYKVEQLPIPNPTTSIKTQVETLVDAVLDGKEHGEDTSALEEAIDRLVYQLYGLTDEEIAIVEGRPVVGSASITVPSDGQVAGWIKAGEAASARVEFKLGVFYNPHTGKKDGSMRNNIVEAVASFLNSQQGGTMLIGVADDGTVVGITEDIKAANPQKNSQDGYGLALSDLLAHRLQYGAISAHYRISYHDVRRQTVCAVSVIPTPEPIWLDGDLYVRDQHGKRKLNARAAQDYIKHRWE
jgi:hypothetical protein